MRLKDIELLNEMLEGDLFDEGLTDNFLDLLM